MFWHLFMPSFSLPCLLVKPLSQFEVILSFHFLSTKAKKKTTTCFASFCFHMGLIYRKFMTNWKLCQKSSKCDDAGCCSFIRLKMAWVWSKTLQIEKSANLVVFFYAQVWSLHISSWCNTRFSKLLDIHEQIKELRIFFKMRRCWLL